MKWSEEKFISAHECWLWYQQAGLYFQFLLWLQGMWWSPCIQNGLTSRDDFHIFKCMLRAILENHPKRCISVVTAVCTLSLGKEITKFSVRPTGSQPCGGQDTQCDIFFSKNSTTCHREIKAALFCLSLGWGAVIKRVTKKKCKTQSKAKDQYYSYSTLSNKSHHLPLPWHPPTLWSLALYFIWVPYDQRFLGLIWGNKGITIQVHI